MYQVTNLRVGYRWILDNKQQYTNKTLHVSITLWRSSSDNTVQSGYIYKIQIESGCQKPSCGALTTWLSSANAEYIAISSHMQYHTLKLIL